jgi:hypothetical protein
MTTFANPPAPTVTPSSSNFNPAVPVRRITKGPLFHWFGYYDKHQFDPTNRFILANQVDFEGRSPTPEDRIQVGMIDIQDGDRWIELGSTVAWNWQQGCMLQWIPGTESEILWNDRVDNQFVCHIMDVKTCKKRTIPAPVYCISPDGQYGFAPDFRRLNDCRPGYGYAGEPDPYRDQAAPSELGIFRIDLKTGKQELIIPLSKTVATPPLEAYSNGAKHWNNHLLVSPDGSRLIFLHRWRGEKEHRGFSTRMFTANIDGSKLHVVDPYGKMSHFVWRDPKHILGWSWHPSAGDKFYVYEDLSDKVEVIGDGVMTHNGHCTYLPGNKWILNDTYPMKETRLQHLYLYEVATGKRISLGDYFSDPVYNGEWRADLHPTSSRDGRLVCIDSAHEGGRQLFLIDVSGIVK